MVALSALILVVLSASIGSADPPQAGPPQAAPPQTGPTQASPSKSAGEVERLIEQLGDDRYVVRINAADRLRLIGLPAFDRLYKAQFGRDIEIGRTARRLIGSIIVRWATPDDSKAVREALDQYSRQTESQRKDRIELLAGLPDREGAPALARIARFETSSRLSTTAAMAIIDQRPRTAELQRVGLATLLVKTLGDTDRLATRWILRYADDLRRMTFDKDSWAQLIVNQRRDIDTGVATSEDRQSTLEFVQTVATHAGRMGRDNDAVGLMMDHVDLVEPKTASLIPIVTWSIDQGFYGIVDRLRSDYRPVFDSSSLLIYAAAESALQQERTDEAQRLADQAIAMPSIPDDEKRETLQPGQLDPILYRHLHTADRLTGRGLHHWAIREYEAIIEAVDVDNSIATNARQKLATLLSELDRHGEVVKVLEPMVERIRKDRTLQLRTPLMQYYTRIVATLQLHRGEVLLEEGQVDEACELMREAYEMDRENVDILIRLFQIDRNDDWNRQIRAMVQTRIQEFERQIDGPAGRGQRLMLPGMTDVAAAYNNYAWLVSNTEGDFARALDYALRSLERTDPDDPTQQAERMDTVARCYYAAGQIEQAIAMQQRAMKRLPHSLPLKKQLQFFESQLATSGGT